MAAAIPVILTAVKVVGTVMSVVSMVKGIKDGNLLQAVVGGFGAFMGVSSLMSSAAAGSATAATEAAASTGAEAAGAMSSTAPASWIAEVDPTQAFSTAGTSTATTGMTTGLTQGATDAIVNNATSTGLLGDATTNLIKQNATDVGKSLGDSLLDTGKQIGGFMKENPELVKVGAGLLGGYTQGAAEEEKMKREEQAANDARKRRGYYATPTGSIFATQQP